MFTKHRKSVDYILLAMASLDEGDMKGAADYLLNAQKEPDLDAALEEMNDSNEKAFDGSMEEESKKKACAASATKRTLRRRPSLAEALMDSMQDSMGEGEDEDESEEDESEEENELDEGGDDVEQRVTARLIRANRNLRALRRS